MNSNTFQDQPGQPLSYKFGSLSHTDAAVRRQAIEHNLECLEIGAALGARAHTVWIGDGGNFPGPAALPARARSLSRQHEGDLSRAARELAAVHRAQVLRAGLLFDGAERLGHELLLRARARRSRVLAGRSRPSRAERERRDDRREADSVRQARRLPLQRQPVRRRRPRCGVGEAVSAVPDFQRARRRRALGRAGIFARLHARPVAQRDRSDRVAHRAAASSCRAPTCRRTSSIATRSRRIRRRTIR